MSVENKEYLLWMDECLLNEDEFWSMVILKGMRVWMIIE